MKQSQAREQKSPRPGIMIRVRLSGLVLRTMLRHTLRRTLLWIFSYSSSIRHYFPSCWAAYEPASGDALRESHPSEDLSELPPVLGSVAGQGYHCRLTGSWRNSLPGLLLAGWTRWAPFLPSLIRALPAQVVLAHSPHRFPPRRGTVS